MTYYTGLAINGKRYSGKSFAAKRLQLMYPKVFGDPEKCPIISLAGPLKEDWCHQTGLSVPTDPVQKDNWRKHIFIFSDRAVQAQPGKYTKIFTRKFHSARLKSNALVICDDLRRQTIERPELETMVDLKMCVMRIECSADTRRKKFGMRDNFEVDTHPTETGLDDNPYWAANPECVIENKGDESFIPMFLDFVWLKFGEQLTAAGYTR